MLNTKKPLLSVKNLTVTFETEEKTITAVRNVSFELSEGEILGLVGESGSGKSVTGMSLLRLIPTPPGKIESGSVFFNECNLLNLPIKELRRIRGKDIGIIFQEPITALSPLHTIGDQLMESLILHNQTTKHHARITSIEWLAKVGIPDPERQMNAYPFQFSGGMRQRVMIAMVLMLNPRIIIADEPTTAVDVTTQRRIFELILRIKKRRTSLILITHDMGVVWQLCDRVLVMKDAEIIENGLLDKIFKNPAQEYTKELLRSVPRLDSPPRRSRIAITDRNTIPPTEIQEEKSPVVQITNLRTWFPVRRGIFARTVGFVKAVDGVSLSVNAGETLALVGESGSGKTTLGRSILGLDKAINGDVFFRKFNLNKAKSSELRSVRRSLQIIFQDPFSSLNPRMTIADIVTEGLIEHQLLIGKKEDT
ncbi:MAG: microcin ABC transporter ATP-binding protein, partial [Rhodospirillaceae bacterium]|nr:microcin ABC transporter ATP-binding protein [Rhodospirillaceae bacterium]